MNTLGSSHTDRSSDGQRDGGSRSSVLNQSMGGQSTRSGQSGKKKSEMSHTLSADSLHKNTEESVIVQKEKGTDGQAEVPTARKQTGTRTAERSMETGSLPGLTSVREALLELGRQPLQRVWGNGGHARAHERYPHGEPRSGPAATATTAAGDDGHGPHE